MGTVLPFGLLQSPRSSLGWRNRSFPCHPSSPNPTLLARGSPHVLVADLPEIRKSAQPVGFGVLELLILHLSSDFLSRVQTLPRPPRPRRRPAGERLRVSRKQPRPAGSGAQRNQAETLFGAKGSVPSSAAAPKPAGCSAEGPAGTGGGAKSPSCGQGWWRGGCWRPVPGAAGGSPVRCWCWGRSPQ